MPDNPISQDEIEQLLKGATPPTQSSAAAAASAPTGGATLGMNEIESLLQSAAAARSADTVHGDAGKRPGAAASRSTATADPRGASGDGGPAVGDIEFLLRQAEEALASVNNPVNPMPAPPVTPFKLQDFAGAPASTEAATLDLIRDVELNLKIELGRTHMYLEDVLKLRNGSVVPLDKLAGDPR